MLKFVPAGKPIVPAPGPFPDEREEDCPGGHSTRGLVLGTDFISDVSGRFFYDSSVSDATGDIYFVRSGNGCGVHVKIFRWHIGTFVYPFPTVASLPSGYDVDYNTATFNDGTHDNVYFDELKCSGKYYSNIYELPAADTAS